MLLYIIDIRFNQETKLYSISNSKFIIVNISCINDIIHLIFHMPHDRIVSS